MMTDGENLGGHVQLVFKPAWDGMNSMMIFGTNQRNSPSPASVTNEQPELRSASSLGEEETQK